MDYNVYDGPPFTNLVTTSARTQPIRFPSSRPRDSSNTPDCLGRFEHLLEPDTYALLRMDHGRTVRRNLGATVFRCTDPEPQPVRARGLEHRQCSRDHPGATESVGLRGIDSHVQHPGEWFRTLLPVAAEQRRRETWIPLQGANSASYTTASTSSSDNGAIFRALVSSVGGSAWSVPVTLTVTA